MRILDRIQYGEGRSRGSLEGYGPRGGKRRTRNESLPLTDEEWEFIAAVERWKKATKRAFPTWSEVLEIVKGLGYRKSQIPNTKSQTNLKSEAPNPKRKRAR